MACGIFVPRPVIEHRAMAVKAPSPNHWTTREFPDPTLMKPQPQEVVKILRGIPGTEKVVPLTVHHPCLSQELMGMGKF